MKVLISDWSMLLNTIFLLVSTPAPATTTPAPDTADKCDEDQCDLPWCYCSKHGTKIPGDLDVEDTPHMVMIMLGKSEIVLRCLLTSLLGLQMSRTNLLFIDGAVNQNNFPFYKRLFKNLTNPNGCKVHGTFILLHDYNNYHNIMELRVRSDWSILLILYFDWLIILIPSSDCSG